MEFLCTFRAVNNYIIVIVLSFFFILLAQRLPTKEITTLMANRKQTFYRALTGPFAYNELAKTTSEHVSYSKVETVCRVIEF